ncbi:MAG: hypothetical protein KDK51_01890 [Deltaproteobacteria bacterium]|nr:hypothetical protein [Deltaproteobacteria bacterium]
MRRMILTFICLLLCTTSSWAEDDITQNQTLESKVPDTFYLHAKITTSDHCTLFILLNQHRQQLWFADLVHPQQKKQNDITIEELIQRQKKLQHSTGLIIDLHDIFPSLKEFQYIETASDIEELIVHFINADNISVQKKFSLPLMYSMYTKGNSIFNHQNKARVCIEEH